jgi:hypothetical protein
MAEMCVHPETGKALRHDVRPQTVKFGSLTRVMELTSRIPTTIAMRSNPVPMSPKPIECLGK